MNGIQILEKEIGRVRRALKKSEREVEKSRTALKEAERSKALLDKRLKQLEEAQITLQQEQEKVFKAAGIAAAPHVNTAKVEPAA